MPKKIRQTPKTPEEEYEERNTSPFVVEIDGQVVYDPFNNPEHKKMQEQAEAEFAAKQKAGRGGLRQASQRRAAKAGPGRVNKGR
jgi:hypothetical protein